MTRNLGWALGIATLVACGGSTNGGPPTDGGVGGTGGGATLDCSTVCHDKTVECGIDPSNCSNFCPQVNLTQNQLQCMRDTPCRRRGE